MQRYYPTECRCGDRIATPEGKRRYVRALFATIADRYDLITVLLSYGQDRRWKRRLIDLAAPRPGRGRSIWRPAPATSPSPLAARGARVVGLDVTFADDRARARERPRAGPARALCFLVGDMLALPFPSGSFDIVTTGYGLRNVPDLTPAIDEIARVLSPAGQLLSLDFNRPSNGVVRAGISRVPDRRRRGARLGAAPRSRHLPLHPGVDSPVSRRRGGRAPAESRGFTRGARAIRYSAG